MLYEGEGTTSTHQDKGGNHQVHISVSSTDLDTLTNWASWCCELGVDCKVSKGYGHKGRRVNGGEYKTIYKCSVFGFAKIIVLYESMKPWLGNRRRTRLEEVLALESAEQRSRRESKADLAQKRAADALRREELRRQGKRSDGNNLSPEGREKLSRLAKERHARGELGGSKFGKLGGRPTGS